LLTDCPVLDKARWVSLLSAAGFSEDDMRRWHVQFERTAPDKHDEFLRRLSIPEREVSAIRAMAAAPRRILNLNKGSGTSMEMLFRLYEGLRREGPGSPAMTRRAYALCQGLPDAPAVLELGCGSGGATLALATLAAGNIVATDVYQPYLDRLRERATQRGVADRVRAVKMDMAALAFEPASFDLIWSEGAAYLMGVDQALAYWGEFLRPGGCLVFSDAVWLSAAAREAAAEELKAFWAEGYPAMRLAEETAAAGEALGYAALGHFTIDTACWDGFYADLERRLQEVEPRYGADPDGRALIGNTRAEIELYRAHPGTYGYAFQVFRK
jgi:SAM-dependent methyltransferase